jgi:hypothetical protein
MDAVTMILLSGIVITASLIHRSMQSFVWYPSRVPPNSLTYIYTGVVEHNAGPQQICDGDDDNDDGVVVSPREINFSLSLPCVARLPPLFY